MHAHTRRRRRWVNRISRIIPALHKLGIRTGRAQRLTTTGRSSGRPRTQPIGVVSLFGDRYISRLIRALPGWPMPAPTLMPSWPTGGDALESPSSKST
jgi:hypothetical protein